MKIHLISGFLGSGKTTAIHQACLASEKQGLKPAVITNDQGMMLVDSFYFRQKGFSVSQVSNGCYCCNYTALDESLQSLISSDKPDIVFAEAVGSCTDMVATVMKPLQRSLPGAMITVSTFVDALLLLLIINGSNPLFDAAILYIFFKQLEEAEIIVVNKTDLVAKEEMENISNYLGSRYPGKELIWQSNFSKQGVSEWLSRINEDQPSETPKSLEIDYEKYASGEARLAWLDKQLTIKNANGLAEANALTLISKITRNTVAAGYAVGHIKYWLNDRIKISVTAGDRMEISEIKTVPSKSADLLINARVETTPDNLVEIAEAAITETIQEQDCEIVQQFSSAFQPGYPVPTYRITE